MTALTKTIHPDDKVKAGNVGGSVTKAGGAIFAVFMVLSIILGSRVTIHDAAGVAHSDDWKRFFYAYLIGWAFIASITIGSLFIVLLHHLTRSRWTTAVRRLAEVMSCAFPWVFAAGLGFIIPVALGNKTLYFWAADDARNVLMHPELHHKLGWLAPGLFAVRYVIYGVIYTAIARYFIAKSRQQDIDGNAELSTRMRVVSAPAMILYAFTTCLLAFDLIMSLAPRWYSTIFGVNFWAGGMIAAFATLGLLTLAIQRSGRLVHSITVEHYHDIGKWMFAWTFFWAYTAFSQFMLQWYGNMPEETVWYKYRLFGDWQWVSIAMLIGHFAFPFVFLMSRWTKRLVPSLVFFAVWQLAFHWLDLYWNAMPEYDWTAHGGPLTGSITTHTVGFSPVDLTLWIAMIGALLIGIGRNLTGNLIPVKDPTLSLSLAHENL